MERDANKTGSHKTGSHKTVTTIVLVIVVLLVVHFGRTLKAYYDGPSVEEALNSPFMRFERECRNTTYTFLYQDVDKLGQTRYYFRHTDGCTERMILTCKFRWVDHIEGLDFRPAGWDYVYTCYVPEDITTGITTTDG